MKLQRRKKILAGAALGLAGMVGAWFLFLSGDGRSYQELTVAEDRLVRETENKRILLDAADREHQRLAKMRQRALPGDAVLARTLYQNWLRGLATHANLHEIKLSAYEGGVRRDQCTRISTTLKCRTALAGLVQFMYEFYSAGFLQQIRRMEVKFVTNSSDLDVNMTIEALSLAAAESKDQLPKETGLATPTKLADYRDAIVKRNLFASYAAPAPPEARAGDSDGAAVAKVTGFTEVDGAWQVWIEDHNGGKRWKWAAGENVAVGSVKGVVKSISAEEVIIEDKGHKRLLRLGDKLAGGTVLGPGQK
jgi:hypothetical protein